MVHDHFRRMTSRGWQSNALLALSFLSILAFLCLIMIARNDSEEMVKFAHGVEYITEKPELQEVIELGD
jgi:hypothetical protein